MHPEFPLSSDVLYLNHAAVSPWPRRTSDAVAVFARENTRFGSQHYPAWLQVEERLRRRLAQLIGSRESSDIALAKNTSEALSIIAYGLELGDGDEVIGIEQEFPSNRVIWESLSDRGVAYRCLDLEQSTDPEADLLAMCGPSTRLVAVSWVQYGKGLRLDLERLWQGCRERGVLLCIDGIQGLGALPFDLARTPVDFLVADGHKWMLGPEGIALLYVRAELRERLTLFQYGWHMLEHASDFERRDWEPAKHARRFECGSPNMLGVHALEASLSLLAETGMEQVAAAISERMDRLIDGIDKAGFELLSPREPARRAGIVTLRVPGVDSAALHGRLMEGGLMCAQRGGGIRLSPHFYTTEETIERALELIVAKAQL